MKTSCLTLVGLAALAATGCTDFPDVAQDTCGNFVLEPGEDCDTSAEFDGLTCGAPNTSHACFFTCDSSGEGCRDGWGCGADGRCRQPSGDFELAADGIYEFPVDQFALGDVDGDGNLDLIGNQGDEVHVLFGDETGAFSNEIEVSTQNPLGPMVFGRFDDDERLDVVVPTADGILVLLGSDERDLEAKTFASAALGADPARLVAVEAADNDLTEAVTIDEMAGTLHFLGSSAGDVSLPGGVSGVVAGKVPAGELLAGGPQEFAVALQGASSVSVYTVAGDFPRGGPNTLQPVLLQDFALPAGSTVSRGLELLDFDGDGDQDLLIAALTPEGERLLVASNTQITGNLFAPATTFSVGGTPVQRRILAVADLTGEGVPDFVFPDGIYVANFESGPGPVTTLTRRVQAGERLWDTAAVGDLNGDGRPDVTTGSSDRNEVNIYLGVGSGLFNQFVVNADRAIKRGDESIAIGDFDGDFIDDIAYAGTAQGGANDSLEVIYGVASGGFASPVSMGELASIEQISTVFDVNAFGRADGIADLAVISNAPEGRTLARLRGTSSRRMVSPYVLSHFDPETSTTQIQIPTAIVTGDFSFPADGITDIIAVANPPAEDPSSEVGQPGVGSTGPSVWLIPGLGGDGSLDIAAQPASIGSDGLFDEGCASWTAGNIDQGLDELIGLDSVAECYSSSSEAESAGDTADLSLLVARPPESAQETFAIDTFEIADSVALSSPRDMQLIDFDGDGAKDLVAIFSGDAFTDDQAATSGTVLFWNVMGDFVQGRIDTEVGDYAEKLEAVRAVHLNDDSFPDWAIVAGDGVYTAIFNPETKYFSSPTRAVSAVGSRLAEVGDVNRDGIEDLVLLFGREVKIMLGVPDAPLGNLEQDEEGE